MRRALVVIAMLAASAAIAAAAGSTDEKGGSGIGNINPPGVFPIAKERMELSIFMSVEEFVLDIETNEAILWLEKHTNLDLKINAGPSKSQEKVSLLLAAQQDLPDMFLTYGAISREQTALYGAQGVFTALDPYLKDGWLPNLESAFKYQPLIRPQITAPDGKIYAFPIYQEYRHGLHSQKMYLNTTWLKRLGLAVPTTTDEFYKVLVAFRDNDANGNGDPNDEIPLLGMKDAWRTDITGFLMQPFAPATERENLYLYNDKGTIRSGLHDPGWPAGMKYLAKLYKEKLLDDESFVMDRAMAKALTGAKQNRLGAIQAGYWGAFANVGVPGARDELNIIGPLKAANGSRRTPYFAPAAAPRFVVTKTSDARKLASMRLGDFFMTDVFSDDPKKIEVGLNLWHGPTGWTRPQGKLGLDGKPALYEWTFKWGEPTNKFIGNLYWLFEPAKIRGAMAALGGNEWDGEKLMWDATKDLYEPYSTDMVVPPIVFPTDRSSKLGETKQILSDYMLEGIASFITGERDVATQWNAFLKEIDDLGFQTYLSAVQNAYNAMYKK